MNQFKTVALLCLLSGLLIAISYGVFGGTLGVILGIGFAALMNVGSWYYSDKIALAAFKAQPVTAEQVPALYQMVERLSQAAEIPMPDVYVIPTAAANAFATGRDPNHAALVVTEGMMQMLPPDELEGVIAHELTHILNRDTLTQAVAATIGGAISLLAQVLTYSLWFGGGSDDDSPNPLGLLATILLAPIAATVIQMTISRTREFSADAGAVALTQNPRALASALKRLEASARQLPIAGNPAFEPLLIMNSFKGGWMTSLFSTHPSTENRVERLLQLEQTLPTMPTTAGDRPPVFPINLVDLGTSGK